MAETIKTSIEIQKSLLDQTEMLAQHLNISRSRLIELALEDFINNQPDLKPDAKIDAEQLVINQGDVYWVQLDDASGLQAGIPHPHVVIQDNVLNHSRIRTVVACAVTSNIKRASLPGNVLLEVGEGNLPKASVVEASKVSTLEKAQLGDYIGSLSEERVNQILAGMRLLQRSFFTR